MQPKSVQMVYVSQLAKMGNVLSQKTVLLTSTVQEAVVYPLMEFAQNLNNWERIEIIPMSVGGQPLVGSETQRKFQKL